MNLDHQVVRDLYPLYIENELSPEVKEAVESHLKECSDCRKIFEDGDGFFDQLKEIEVPSANSTLDEKILLKIRLNRFKWMTLFLTGIIVVMFVTDYKNDREKLFNALSNYYSTQNYLPGTFSIVKSKEYSDLENVQHSIHQFFEDKIELEEHFNFYEKSQQRKTKYYLSMNTSRLNSMLEIMQTRYDQDRWSDTDEAAYQALQKYFRELNGVVTNEYEEMNHGFSSYFETLNIEEMENFYKNVNTLSYVYTRHHKLPEQLTPLSTEDLKRQIAKVIDIPVDQIKLTKESPLNYEYTYRFESSSKGQFSGRIDTITGQILQIHGVNDLTDGPLLSEEDAENRAKQYLKRIYGSSINFQIESLGFNYNNTANDPRYKVFSYKAVPTFSEYKLYIPFDNHTMIYIDARTGELNNFFQTPHVPSFQQLRDMNFTIDSEQVKDQTEQVIIYSAITGEFEFVHMDRSLEDFEEGKFKSASTGLEERIYFSEL